MQRYKLTISVECLNPNPEGLKNASIECEVDTTSINSQEDVLAVAHQLFYEPGDANEPLMEVAEMAAANEINEID